MWLLLLLFQTPQTISLEAAMAAAAQRPEHLALLAERDAHIREAATVRRLSRLPDVSLSAGYQRTEPDRALNTPFGPLPQGDTDTRFARVLVRQPIWQPAESRYKAPALDKLAEAKQHMAESRRQNLARKTGEAYVTILRIDAQIKSTRAFIKSLTARVNQVSALVQEGRALKSDLLKIESRREGAGLDLIRLKNHRGVALDDLARMIGSEQPVEPLNIEDSIPDHLDKVRADNALTQHPDLEAMRTGIHGLALEEKGITAEFLPTLGAELDWQSLDPSPFTERNILEARLAVSWKPFASGSRKTRAAAVTARKKAATHRLTEAERLVKIGIAAARADFDTARAAVRVRGIEIDQARETLRVEAARYQEGRATLNDVLEFEALLRDRRTQQELAYLDVLSAWLDYRLATGSLGH